MNEVFKQFKDLRDDIKALIEEMQELNSNIEELEELNDNLEALNRNMEDFMGGLEELEE